MCESRLGKRNGPEINLSQLTTRSLYVMLMVSHREPEQLTVYPFDKEEVGCLDTVWSTP